MYNIQYHALDGSDGGTLAAGFNTIEEARQWWKENKEDFDGDVVQIHEEDGDTYGEAVEDLNNSNVP